MNESRPTDWEKVYHDECLRLGAEITRLVDIDIGLRRESRALESANAVLKSRIEKLRGALEWYASEDTWAMQRLDLSDLAREALAEDEGEKCDTT